MTPQPSDFFLDDFHNVTPKELMYITNRQAKVGNLSGITEEYGDS
jgi:hypothetical protein